jgi:hypothetical protein
MSSAQDTNQGERRKSRVSKSSPGGRRKFGRWRLLEITKDGWRMRCACGTERLIRNTRHVIAGNSTSCGCKQREALTKRNRTHGLSQHPLHGMWKGMNQRCYNRKHKQYHDYGGRGITICARWRGEQGFANFVADMAPRPPGGLIERKDNDEPYSPANCCWSDRKHQNRNKRNSLMLTHAGKTQCLAAWAEETGINYGTLFYRLKTRGMTPTEAFTA